MGIFDTFSTWTTRRYVFFIVWLIVHVLLFIWGFFRVHNDKDLINLNEPLNWSLWISRAAGMCLIWDCAAILVPVCRNLISILRVSWLNKIIPVDENIWFHKITAYSIVICTAIHGAGHYVNVYRLDAQHRINPEKFPHSAAQLLYTSYAGTTGHIMLFCMVLMYTTAKESQRKKSFETFWYTHHLAFVFFIALLLHGLGCIVQDQHGRCRGYNSWQVFTFFLALYVIERGIRFVRARKETRLIKVIQHPANVIELRIQKPGFTYKPGQYMFINIPELSEYQWHPFTITSSPFEDYISVHIRQVGDWTRALGRRMGIEKAETPRGKDGSAGKGGSKEAKIADKGEEVVTSKSLTMPRICIDGPFGAPTEDVFNHEIVVLVGSGIGVTPFAGILRDIWYRANNNCPLKTKRIEFFWVSRDLSSFKWFQSLLAAVESSMMSVKLNIHIYCTAVMKADQHHNLALNMMDSSVDVITGLQALTNFGRPNFGAVFTELRNAILTGQIMPGATQQLMVDVAVFFCGPAGMAKSLRNEARRQSKNGVKFSFRKEHF
ncbi:hypothetical protein BGW41_007939 [Actinomortierella wolfii]|nr:hypothetical protein BGW41_007939 [Actinomortierella wolfii]